MIPLPRRRASRPDSPSVTDVAHRSLCGGPLRPVGRHDRKGANEASHVVGVALAVAVDDPFDAADQALARREDEIADRVSVEIRIALPRHPDWRVDGEGIDVNVALPRKLAAAHAGYYVVTGAWAVLHRRSFELVTGPKHDYWLVRLVGGLALAVGASLGTAVATGRKSQADTTLALTTSLAFVVADVHAARSMSRVYLGDVVLHAIFVPAWIRPWS